MTASIKLHRLRRQAAWKILRLYWTFCLRNRNLHKPRFSRRLIDKILEVHCSPPFPIPCRSQRLRCLSFSALSSAVFSHLCTGLVQLRTSSRPVDDTEDHVRGRGRRGVWDAVDTSLDFGSQNVLKTFEMAIRHNKRPTRTKLERESFLSLDLFSLTFKNIFLALQRGDRPHRSLMDPPLVPPCPGCCCQLADDQVNSCRLLNCGTSSKVVRTSNITTKQSPFYGHYIQVNLR